MTGLLSTTASAESGTRKRIRPFKVEFRVRLSESDSPRECSCASNGKDTIPAALPIKTCGSRMIVLAYVSQVMEAGVRYDPNQRMIHSSVMSQERASIIGMLNFTNSRKPG